MDFNLTEEQLMVQQAARDFAQNELLPGVIERDEKQIFPAEQIKKMGELGFMGMMVDPKYGGSGLDTISYVLAMEEISKVDASASVVMSVNNSLVCWGLQAFGSEEQKEQWLPLLASGQIRISRPSSSPPYSRPRNCRPWRVELMKPLRSSVASRRSMSSRRM